MCTLYIMPGYNNNKKTIKTTLSTVIKTFKLSNCLNDIEFTADKRDISKLCEDLSNNELHIFEEETNPENFSQSQFFIKRI